MFTGIVENLGQIVSLAFASPQVAQLRTFTTLDLSALSLGASIAVNGVCLTITEKSPATLQRRRGTTFKADLGPETLARTTLGQLKAGDRVHLERALRMGDSLGGHLVAGHVDDVGRVVKSTRYGEALELVVEVPKPLVEELVGKGSVTIDGVSLTVNWVRGRTFQVMLIPHTLAVTTLGERVVGDRVNIETDLMAKHVIRVVNLHLKARRKAPAAGGKQQRTSRER